jgi:hypothetical protein
MQQLNSAQSNLIAMILCMSGDKLVINLLDNCELSHVATSLWIEGFAIHACTLPIHQAVNISKSKNHGMPMRASIARSQEYWIRTSQGRNKTSSPGWVVAIGHPTSLFFVTRLLDSEYRKSYTGLPEIRPSALLESPSHSLEYV